MNESIARDNIRIGMRAGSWQEAIRVAAEPLVERGSIEPVYVERMIDSVNTLGPYIVMMPKFALAHAAPGEDVRESDLSLAVFSDDIEFHCDNDPVRIVMCLACVDREAHIARLQGIAEKLLDESFVGQMLACTSEQQLYDLMNA